MTAEDGQPMSPGRKDNPVARRIKLTRAHPEVDFLFRQETGKWEASYPAGRNGIHVVYGSELGDVLDKLEERLG